MTGRRPDDKAAETDARDDEDAVGALQNELVLAELRAHRSRTQAQVARAIGTTQSAISRLERQPDLLVSTLNEFVSATGGRLRLVADYGTHEVDLHLPALQPADPEIGREFRVIWQNLQTRQLVHVGWLRLDDGRYSFEYTPEAELDRDFQPFAAFPDLRADYEAGELFAFFADRVATTAEPGLGSLASALGLRRESATPVELLARSWGKSSHDTIQIVPEPEQLPDGSTSRLFLVSGVSHADEARPARVSKVVAGLKPGQQLTIVEEPDNPVDADAVVIEHRGQRVGWVPAYLLAGLHKAGLDRVAVFVEHANGPDTPWHLRLLCRIVTRPALPA